MERCITRDESEVVFEDRDDRGNRDVGYEIGGLEEWDGGWYVRGGEEGG